MHAPTTVAQCALLVTLLVTRDLTHIYRRQLTFGASQQELSVTAPTTLSQCALVATRNLAHIYRRQLISGASREELSAGSPFPLGHPFPPFPLGDYRRADCLRCAGQDKVWKPDFYWEKSITINGIDFSDGAKDGRHASLFRVSPDGSVFWSQQARFKLACNLEFDQLPFDSQAVNAKLRSDAHAAATSRESAAALKHMHILSG